MFYVAVNRINLRPAPDFRSGSIMLLNRNEEVEKLKEVAEWFQVRVRPSGELGWINSKYLVIKSPP